MEKNALNKRYLQVPGIILLSITFIVLIAIHSFAQTPSLATLVEGAKKEGKVVIYSTMTVDQSMVLSKNFETKYPFLKMHKLKGKCQKYLVEGKIFKPTNIKISKGAALLGRIYLSTKIPLPTKSS